MMMTTEDTLHEILGGLQKYADDDVFESFKMNEFFRYGPTERIAVLSGWDKKMEMETKPNRETAELIAKKRELNDLHFLLKKAGR
jgi:hypothetical protein